jgi:polyphenol oxidase
MIVSIGRSCSFFFGDAITCSVSHKSPHYINFCDSLRHDLGLNNLIFQHQTHGTNGLIIDSPTQLSQPTDCYSRDGDFLITNQKGVGIGVLTADCLPIIFYVAKPQTIAVAHAGWRGSVAGIGPKVVSLLQSHFHADPAHIQIFFGPSAKPCCYQVTEDFLLNFKNNPLAEDIFTKRDSKLFFDNPTYNAHLLQNSGILPQSIDQTFNLCTICNHQFHSYRRAANKETYIAQPTIAWLW